MSSDVDDIFSSALEEFQLSEDLIGGPIPGAASAHKTVAHRRRVRLTTFGVLGALLIAAPLAAFAANPRGNNSPPMSSTPSPTSDWPFSLERLTRTTVDVPKWTYERCAYGALDLPGAEPGSRNDGYPPIWIEKVVPANLDSDSDLEAAALLFCRTGREPVGIVIALGQNADGKIVTTGRIFEGLVEDIRTRAEGGVAADVYDTTACCGVPSEAVLRQTRSYAWNGSKFTQVAGPTRFVPHVSPIDLSLKAKTATWSAPYKKGGQTVRTVTVVLKASNLSAEGTGQWMIIAPGGEGSILSGAEIQSNPLAAKASAEVTIVAEVADAKQLLLQIYELGSMTGIEYLNMEDDTVVIAPPK